MHPCDSLLSATCNRWLPAHSLACVLLLRSSAERILAGTGFGGIPMRFTPFMFFYWFNPVKVLPYQSKLVS